MTGDVIDGREAARIGLVSAAVSEDDLDAHVEDLLRRISSVPRNQLMMQKFLVNQALDNMGLASTQAIATLFDGITRHSPEGIYFRDRMEVEGFKPLVEERDGGGAIADGVSKPSIRREIGGGGSRL